MKALLLVSVSFLSGSLITKGCIEGNNKPITGDTVVVEKIIEIPSEPITTKITTFEVKRDTVEIVNDSMIASEAGKLMFKFVQNLDFYRINFEQDFEPTPTFQGTNVKASVAITLIDRENIVKPNIIPKLSYITLEPYPMIKLTKEITIHKDYPLWKKIGIFVVGVGVGYGASTF